MTTERRTMPTDEECAGFLDRVADLRLSSIGMDEWEHAFRRGAEALRASRPSPAERDRERIEQMRRAISWACGAEDSFEPPPGVRSPFWWRSELCARAGLDWNGTEFTFAASRVSGASDA